MFSFIIAFVMEVYDYYIFAYITDKIISSIEKERIYKNIKSFE
ncbi:hypothetical protein CSCA_0451 [Clostridium scatologenes]|uniref:Uncharacterized protein n=1 Tax=Clostridium scatologenes TaxID=1548 RepID=A0A0E3GPX4_CLOSL|nr:hypothetical protein CSCA_0451 [Clostridium scatologenes]